MRKFEIGDRVLCVLDSLRFIFSIKKFDEYGYAWSHSNTHGYTGHGPFHVRKMRHYHKASNLSCLLYLGVTSDELRHFSNSLDNGAGV